MQSIKNNFITDNVISIKTTGIAMVASFFSKEKICLLEYLGFEFPPNNKHQFNPKNIK